MSILKQAENGTPVSELCREHVSALQRSTTGEVNMGAWMLV